MKSLAIIQARISSERLPGKVMMKIGDKTLLDRTIDSAHGAKMIEKVYVATSNDSSDDILVDHLKNRNVLVYRGSLNNVFSRYYEIANEEKGAFGSIVRLTGDCPLLDPRVIDKTIEHHNKGSFEYTSTGLSKTFPMGQAVEVIDLPLFLSLDEKKLSKDDLEHVTRHIWKRPDSFRCGEIRYQNKKYPNSKELRITVDQIEDFQLVKKIIEGLDYVNEKKVSIDDVVDYLYKNPELIEINKYVKQVET